MQQSSECRYRFRQQLISFIRKEMFYSWGNKEDRQLCVVHQIIFYNYRNYRIWPLFLSTTDFFCFSVFPLLMRALASILQVSLRDVQIVKWLCWFEQILCVFACSRSSVCWPSQTRQGSSVWLWVGWRSEKWGNCNTKVRPPKKIDR